MGESSGVAITMFNWLLTYWLHSAVLLGVVWMLTRVLPVRAARTKDRLWRAGLVGGFLTATVQLALDVQPAGGLISTSMLQPVSVTEPVEGRSAPVPDVEHATTPSPATYSGSLTRWVSLDSPVSGGPAPRGVETPATSAPSIATASTTSATAPSVSSRVAAGVRNSPGWVMAHPVPVLVGAWLLFALVGWGRVFEAGHRLRRSLAHRRDVTDSTVLATVDRLARRADFAGPVRVTTSPTLRTPISFGRREICVPEAAFTELSDPERSLMLAHELGHLVRRDPQWLLVAAWIERVFAFQPLNRVARRAVQEEAEYVCDDFAVRLHGGGGVDLASCLARVASWSDGRASPMISGQSPFVRRVKLLLEGRGATIAAAPRAVSLLVTGVLVVALITLAPRAGSRVADAEMAVIDATPMIESSPPLTVDASDPSPRAGTLKRPNVERITDGIVVYDEGFEPGAAAPAPKSLFTLLSNRNSTFPALRAADHGQSAQRADREAVQRDAERAAQEAERAYERQTRDSYRESLVMVGEAREALAQAYQLARESSDEVDAEVAEAVDDALESVREELAHAQALIDAAREAGDVTTEELHEALQDANRALQHALGLGEVGIVRDTEGIARFEWQHAMELSTRDLEPRVHELQTLGHDLQLLELDELRNVPHVFDLSNGGVYRIQKGNGDVSVIWDWDHEELEDLLEELDLESADEIRDLPADTRDRLVGLAIEADDPELLEMLLQDGVFETEEEAGWKFLLGAINNGHEAVFDVLVDHGVGLASSDIWGISPLHQAAQEGEDYMVERLLDAGEAVDGEDEHGRTALHLAASEGEWDVVGLLLDRGSDPNHIDDWDRTPLHYAASEDEPDVVHILLDRGARVDMVDLNGQTALHLAARESDYDTCDALLRGGADPDVLDEDERSPLDIAARENHDEIVNLMLDHSREQR
jgi:beta-lactamase regulating signal transducer with metallopeptidase domain